MAELKTKENEASVEGYINAAGDEKVQADCRVLFKLMKKATGAEPKMWGDKIVGFGKYQYKSAATGKGGDWFLMGFAARTSSLAVYLMSGYTPEVKDCLARLGKHKLSGSCIHIKRLSDVDVKVLEEMIMASAKTGPKYAAEAKTKVNDADVRGFINSQEDERVRADCDTIINMMQKATGNEPKMWGPAIIGFGTYTYKYASGKTGDWPRIAFSPRKASLTLYLVPGFEKMPLLEKLGKHTTSKACLYIKRLSDVDLNVLQKIIDSSLKEMGKLYPVK